MKELKIKQVWNTQSKRFSPKDINNPKKLAEMRATQPLTDEDFNEVIIHTGGDIRAHFKLKTGQKPFERTPDDGNTKHNDGIEFLLDRLIANFATSELFTKIWLASKQPGEKKLWSAHPSSKYTWYAEPSTRILMESSSCVQPDLVGIDSTRLNRTSTNPSIIIEVVNSHWPDEATWFNLVKLSTMNYIVAFYFVEDEMPLSGYANKATDNNLAFKMVVNCYLQAGKFYREGKLIMPIGTNSYIYNYIKEEAMSAAKREFAKEREKKR